MNIEQLRTYCLSKKGCTEELPFGPDTLVFRVTNKVFALVGLDQVDQLSFNLKGDPDANLLLREKHPQTVFPGYHMNKQHWNTVFANRELPDASLHQLIDESYTLVVKKLTKAEQASLEKDEQ